MKLESLKDIEPLKNKNIITLNTIGRADSSEDEESEDNQLTDLIDLFDMNNLKSQFTDKLQISKLTLAYSLQDRKKGRIEELYPRKNWYPKRSNPSALMNLGSHDDSHSDGKTIGSLSLSGLLLLDLYNFWNTEVFIDYAIFFFNLIVRSCRLLLGYIS